MYAATQDPFAPQPAATAVAEAPPAEAPAAPAKPSYKDWPVKGGDGHPQPWDLQALGVDTTGLEPGKKPNPNQPIVITHRYPILGPGTCDVAAVTKLGELLAALGYETSLSHGQNPFGVVDESVLAASQQFRNDFGVEEDPTAFGGNNDHTRQLARNHIGPWTWEALLRAVERES